MAVVNTFLNMIVFSFQLRCPWGNRFSRKNAEDQTGRPWILLKVSELRNRAQKVCGFELPESWRAARARARIRCVKASAAREALSAKRECPASASEAEGSSASFRGEQPLRLALR